MGLRLQLVHRPAAVAVDATLWSGRVTAPVLASASTPSSLLASPSFASYTPFGGRAASGSARLAAATAGGAARDGATTPAVTTKDSLSPLSRGPVHEPQAIRKKRKDLGMPARGRDPVADAGRQLEKLRSVSEFTKFATDHRSVMYVNDLSRPLNRLGFLIKQQVIRTWQSVPVCVSGVCVGWGGVGMMGGGLRVARQLVCVHGSVVVVWTCGVCVSAIDGCLGVSRLLALDTTGWQSDCHRHLPRRRQGHHRHFDAQPRVLQTPGAVRPCRVAGQAEHRLWADRQVGVAVAQVRRRRATVVTTPPNCRAGGGAVVGRVQNGLCVGSCWLPPPSSSPRLVNPIGRDTLLQLVRTVADLSLEKLPQFNAGQLVTLSWAMARMECTFLVPELFPAVCAAATPLLPAMTPQCLSELSWAVRKHLTSGSVSVERRNRDRETLAAIARASVKVAWEFKEVELSQLLWGLMDARAADAASVYGVLARACVSRMGAMQPRTLCTVAWSFASVAATEEPVDEGSGSDIGGSDTLVPRATLMVCVCTWSAL